MNRKGIPVVFPLLAFAAAAQLGVVSYDFSPYTATPAEGASEHGDNERIRIEELRRGFRAMYDVAHQLAAASRE